MVAAATELELELDANLDWNRSRSRTAAGPTKQRADTVLADWCGCLDEQGAIAACVENLVAVPALEVKDTRRLPIAMRKLDAARVALCIHSRKPADSTLEEPEFSRGGQLELH